MLLLALGCYAAVTLVVPLLRGAALSPEYLRHAATVLLLVGGLSAFLFALRGRTWRRFPPSFSARRMEPKVWG